MFKKVNNWLRRPFRSVKAGHASKRSMPPVYFDRIITVQKPPRNEEIGEGTLYYVAPSGKPKWSLFQCPCGCGSVITLSLQYVHTPHWRLEKSVSGNPTLHPSVWRDKECLSHFWVKEGRVFWCVDTGTHPNLRRYN